MPSPLLPTRRRSRARQYAIYPRKKSLGENRRPFSPPRWNTLGTRTRLGFLIRACASRKIPVEPVDYERANRPRKLDPRGGRVYTRTPSFSLSLSPSRQRRARGCCTSRSCCTHSARTIRGHGERDQRNGFPIPRPLSVVREGFLPRVSSGSHCSATLSSSRCTYRTFPVLYDDRANEIFLRGNLN